MESNRETNGVIPISHKIRNNRSPALAARPHDFSKIYNREASAEAYMRALLVLSVLRSYHTCFPLIFEVMILHKKSH